MPEQLGGPADDFGEQNDQKSRRERSCRFDEREKHILIEATRKLAEIIRRDEIKNIVFVDNSARPAATALREYWTHQYPDEDMPGLYFVNPFGFKNSNDVEEMHKQTGRGSRVNRSMDMLTAAGARDYQEIDEEFREKYGSLIKDKKDPLILLDTCAHYGTTLKPILSSLSRLGFGDVRVVLASIHSRAIEASDTLVPNADCYPFGMDTATIKHQGSVQSFASGGYKGQSEDAKRARQSASDLREDIKQIISGSFDT